METDIRADQRSVAQTMNLVVVFLALAAAATKDDTQRAVLMGAPVILSAICVYNLNVASDAAARSEHRDRLAAMINKRLGEEVFASRAIADIRRGSLGTISAYLLAGIVVTASLIVGIVASVSAGGFFPVFEVVLVITCIAAIIVAFIELPLSRYEANNALDQIYGQETGLRQHPSRKLPG